MKQRSLVLLLVMVACAAGLSAPCRAAEERPNILFILIDDLGWMDLHCQGNSAVHTPRIDGLAAQGMRFTDAYAAAPVCSPTRAALVTGQAPARLQITNHIPDRDSFIPDDAKLLPAAMLDHLPLETTTIAERLQNAGYATAFLGKWHLSGPRKLGRSFEPDRQGFDQNLGGCGLGGPPTYFDPYRIPNLPSRTPGEYLPDRLADEAIAFMTENCEERFFVCLWNYTVHWPMEAPAPLLQKYAGHTGPGLNDSRYGAMIEAMDLAMGRVFDALERLELKDNTLVIFTSDNGGFSGVADNRPLRSGKGDLYEGGIRVPLIVRWPGKVEPGSRCRTPVISMDFYPTLLEAAGIDPEASRPLDGESLVPLLQQTGKLSRSALFFHYPNYAWHRSNRLGGAIRKGPYKLIERFDDGSLELFDLENDLSEKRNLETEQPEIAAEMARELQAWRDRVGAAMPTRPAEK